MGRAYQTIYVLGSYSTTSSNNFDGSDIPLIDSTISFSPNGTAHSAVDDGFCSTCVSGSILADSINGSANETVPWIQVGDFRGKSTATREPGTLMLLGSGLLGLAGTVKRKFLS